MSNEAGMRQQVYLKFFIKTFVTTYNQSFLDHHLENLSIHFEAFFTVGLDNPYSNEVQHLQKMSW